MIVSFIFIVLITPASAETSWHDNVTLDAEFHWHAEKADLRDLKNTEKYKFGIGGINVEGGDIEVTIDHKPIEFDFFFNHTLFDSLTVEGDMDLHIPTLNSTENGYYFYLEYQLLILPIIHDDRPFFDFFFEHTEFIANLTHTSFVETLIVDNMAIYKGVYNGTHNAEYQWDTETGLLWKKKIEAESGLMLHVVQGKGTGFMSIPISVNPIISGIIIALIIKRKSLGKMF